MNYNLRVINMNVITALYAAYVAWFGAGIGVCFIIMQIFASLREIIDYFKNKKADENE